MHIIRGDSSRGFRCCDVAQLRVCAVARATACLSGCAGITCAAGAPSARILACARTRSRPRAIEDLGKNPNLGHRCFYPKPSFSFGCAFYPNENEGSRAERTMPVLRTLVDIGGQVGLSRKRLRGRRPVRADPRLHTDEKPSVCNRGSWIKANPNCSRLCATHTRMARVPMDMSCLITARAISPSGRTSSVPPAAIASLGMPNTTQLASSWAML